MKIINCGYDYRHPSDFSITRPNGTGDYVFLVLRSPAVFTFHEKKCTTKGDAVVIFEKGVPQLYGAYGAEYINDWVQFEAEQEEFEELKQNGVIFNCIVELHTVSVLSGIIGNICREMYSDNKNAGKSTILYLQLLFNKFSDLNSIKVKINKSVLYERLLLTRQEIYAKPQIKWTVPMIAQSLFISLSYMQHQYKEFFGTSIMQDITNSRIERVKQLLFSTDYSVSSISQMCGYENEVHFMRVFKSIVGLTPSQYRTNISYSNEETDI